MVLQRHDMPAMFGPSLLPDRSQVRNADVVSVSFVTSADAAARLLPKFYKIAEPPIVSLTWIDYPSVEYLGGRGYRELVVAVSAVHGSEANEIRAGFAPVMWVDQVGALISGREYMGFAKLPGELTGAHDNERWSRSCREYGAPLVDAEVSDLTPLSIEGLARVNKAAEAVATFGWKYIASDGEKPDADYPLVNYTRWQYSRAWSGEGCLHFYAPDALVAPLSSRVVAALSKLPVIEYRRAFVAVGDVVIDRAATRRLGTD